MISILFTVDSQKNIQSFTCSGHAGSGPYGSDIVCAAVSALTISTVNGMEALAHLTPKVEIDVVEGGYLSVELNDSNTTAQILLQNLYLALRQLQEENETYIDLSIQEVQ